MQRRLLLLMIDTLHWWLYQTFKVSQVCQSSMRCFHELYINVVSQTGAHARIELCFLLQRFYVDVVSWLASVVYTLRVLCNGQSISRCWCSVLVALLIAVISCCCCCWWWHSCTCVLYVTLHLDPRLLASVFLFVCSSDDQIKLGIERVQACTR